MEYSLIINECFGSLYWTVQSLFYIIYLGRVIMPWLTCTEKTVYVTWLLQSWTKDDAARKINSHNITGQTAAKHYMKLLNWTPFSPTYPLFNNMKQISGSNLIHNWLCCQQWSIYPSPLRLLGRWNWNSYRVVLRHWDISICTSGKTHRYITMHSTSQLIYFRTMQNEIFFLIYISLTLKCIGNL